MKEKLNNIKETALADIHNASTPDELEATRVKYLGRKGKLAEALSAIPSLSKEERPIIGKLTNEIKTLLTSEISKAQGSIARTVKTTKLNAQDLTMPGRCFDIGHEHPIAKTMQEICNIFSHMGYAVVEGPEIETEYNNFEALNIPLDHSSRDAFDTFYVENNLLLRSHTSPVQIRYMQAHTPPFSIVAPGKVYRPDAVDASHSFMFHQVEGLMVSENITFAHLKGSLVEFAKQFFGEDVKLRFRPHFFPFTEPSVEVDISCIICKGEGCSVCSKKGWLEVLGAGMVDPAVFNAVGIDNEKYSGFAFGMGVERMAMLKYRINDIRLFYENDIRFLEQF